MSDFDIGGVGLFNPTGIVPAQPRLGQTPPHQQTLAAAPETGQANGAGPAERAMDLSQDLQTFCKSLSDSARARQSRTRSNLCVVLKPYVQPNLLEDVKKAGRLNGVRKEGKSGGVKRSSPHKQDLRDSFAIVHKPVIFLDADGYTEYVFVHVEGGWRGFDGAFRPLPATDGPADAMMNISNRSNSGMWFTQYDVEGEFRVIKPPTEKPDDAHAHDDENTDALRRESASDDALRGRSDSIRPVDSVANFTLASLSSAEVSPSAHRSSNLTEPRHG